MSKILVIVESPGKIKKLQDILGDKYKIMSSIGHVMDLAKKELSIDVKNKFKPTYSVMDDKHAVVSDLKKAVMNAKDVLLATDKDREGEMIAWSLAHILGLKDPKRITFISITKSELEKAVSEPGKIDTDMVDAQKARRILDRIVGYELSPILWKSISAGSLSAGRVQSVVVRLIIDKEDEIKTFFEKESSSFFKFTACFVGERGKKFNAFLGEAKKTKTKSKSKTKEVSEKPESDDDEESSEEEEASSEEPASTNRYVKANIYSESGARNIMKEMTKSTFKIDEIQERDSIRNPSLPFTTSTLQQEAAGRLGFSVKRTMTAAQKLYEGGYITYMRTDSVNLSKEALSNISEYIEKTYGKSYLKTRVFSAKSKNTQEAHEAIRPTDVFCEHVKEKGKQLGSDESKLYSLIWKRTVACQMVPAKLKIIDVIISISRIKEYVFMTTLQNVVSPGFLLVYNITPVQKDDTEEEDLTETVKNESIRLPKKGTSIDVDELTAVQEYERPPTRYSEATLVGKLDPHNLNIGRPSTYGSIIEKIQTRDYVRKQDVEGVEKESLKLCWDGAKSKIHEKLTKVVIGQEKNKLVPTSMGRLVTEFLVKNFPDVMDYKFTALMEENLDKIAEGKAVWYKVLEVFYNNFHPVVDALLKKKKTVIEETARKLGTHPTSGLDIYVSMAKYGPVVKMCKSATKCEYAPITAEKYETITLDEAVKMFEYPKLVGAYKGKKIYLNKGKYGRYLVWEGVKVSIEPADPKAEPYKDKDGNIIPPKKFDFKDPEKITEEQAIALLEERRKNIYWEETDPKTKKTYTILEGPYGKFIRVKENKKISKPLNVKLPEEIKEEEIKEMTLERINEIISQGMEAKKNRFKKKKNGEKSEKGETETGGGKTKYKKKTYKKPKS